MPDIRLKAGLLNAGAWNPLSYTANAFNSLADGAFVRFTDVIDNDTNGDLMAEVEWSGIVGGTTVARSLLRLFLLPKRSDSRYGDNTGSGATPPNTSFWVSSLPIATGITSTNTAYSITPRPFLIPRGSWMLGVQSGLTVALSAAPSVAAAIRTTNLQSV